MQPHEFNAFVAAIVSARTAELLSPARAKELVESAASRAGFAMKVTSPHDPDFRDAALNNMSSICKTNPTIVGRRITLLQAFKAKLLKDGTKLFIEAKVADIENEDYDGLMPAELECPSLEASDWVRGDIEVILNG